MTPTFYRNLAQAILLTPAYEVGGWEVEQDMMTGALYLWHRSVDGLVWATPGWEGQSLPVHVETAGNWGDDAHHTLTVTWTGSISECADLYWAALAPILDEVISC